MHEAAAIKMPSGVKRLFKRIKNEAGMRCAADPPADNAAGKHIDHEGDIDKSAPGRNISEVRDPEHVRRVGLEVAIDMIERARRRFVTERSAMRFSANYALNTDLFHQSLDCAAGDIDPLSLHLLPNFVRAIDTEVLSENPKDLRLQSLVLSNARRRSVWAMPPRIRFMIC